MWLVKYLHYCNEIICEKLFIRGNAELPKDHRQFKALAIHIYVYDMIKDLVILFFQFTILFLVLLPGLKH